MPRRAHRRCKEQGPTCLGVTHPGFDICSRCLYDVVRPRMKARKEAMRQRKANRLSHANRSLISEVDLKEPQMVHAETDAYIWESVPELPVIRSVADAIHDVELERRANELLAKHADPVDALNEVLLNIAALDTPVILPPGTPLPKHQEEPEEDMPKLAPPVRRHRGTVTPELRQEIATAYTDGMAVEDICKGLNVGIGTIYSTLNKLSIPRRSKAQEAPEVAKASEPVSPPIVENTPSNGVVSGLTTWTVTYYVRGTDTKIVSAKSFNDAAKQVEELGYEVVSVSRDTTGTM